MRSAVASDYASWRSAARALLADGVAPEEIDWQEHAGESLFDAPSPERTASPTAARIPRDLAELLEACACHADPARWSVMYRALWRATHGERELLADAADADVTRLAHMAKAVRREE